MSEIKYKDLKKFSSSTGIPQENLVKAFEIERDFHFKILNEPSAAKRKKLYEEVYITVHKIYGKTENDINKLPNPKDSTVELFKKELENKSILDVGCGEGYFLASISRLLNSKDLVGIDVSIPKKSYERKDIKFIKSDIIEFQLEQKFDVVFADQVLEHIAPADLKTFLISVKNALKKDGKFIFLMPNPLFGPSDVTRIKDFSYCGKIKSEGTHLNESTYSEIIPLLLENGFSNFRMPLQLPKFKKWFKGIRIRPSALRFLENNKPLLKILYGIKYRGHPLFKFETILICS